MTDPAVLPRATRWFIVLAALFQGLVLFAINYGYLGGRMLDPVIAYALALSLPTAMILSVQRLDDARFWQQAAGLAVLYALLAGWAAWSVGGAPELERDDVLWPFTVSLGVGLFIALPYLQCRLAHGRWSAPYPELFEHGWQNALTLALAAAFVGLCWAVLGLCAALFKLIGIEFFAWLFSHASFTHLATGTMFGLGVLVGRTQQRPVRIARQILFAVFKGLLPLIAMIALLFVASLPFTGLEALWRTRSAALILMCLVATLVLFVNAVYQDGEGEPPYPRWLRRVVGAALLCLPVYAALGGYALALRIGQYGWTAERFWASLATAVLGAYALGYAWAALRSREGWLRPLARVNVAVSLAILAVVAASNSWLLDPHRLTVGDQLARLADGRTPATKFDLKLLRFHAGRRGYEALQALKSEPKFAEPAQRQRVLDALAATNPWGIDSTEEPEQAPAPPATTPAQLAARIRLATGAEAPGESWLAFLLEEEESGEHRCQKADIECVLLTPDLDGDGRRERVLCPLSDGFVPHCWVYSQQAPGLWVQVADFFPPQGDAANAAIRAGQLRTVPPRWPNLRLGADDTPLIEPQHKSEEDVSRETQQRQIDKEREAPPSRPGTTQPPAQTKT